MRRQHRMERVACRTLAMLCILGLTGCGSSNTSLQGPKEDFGFGFVRQVGDPLVGIGSLTVCVSDESAVTILAVRAEKQIDVDVVDEGVRIVADSTLIGDIQNPDLGKLGFKHLPAKIDNVPCSQNTKVAEIMIVMHALGNGAIDGLLIDYSVGGKSKTLKLPMHVKFCPSLDLS